MAEEIEVKGAGSAMGSPAGANVIQGMFFLLGIAMLVAGLIAAFLGDWGTTYDAFFWQKEEILAVAFGGFSLFFFLMGTIIHVKG